MTKVIALLSRLLGKKRVGSAKLRPPSSERATKTLVRCFPLAGSFVSWLATRYTGPLEAAKSVS